MMLISVGFASSHFQLNSQPSLLIDNALMAIFHIVLLTLKFLKRPN
ncbi:TPA: hypothetical protein U1729_001593 [Streptococcus suis]|nr:hypothetical protein [Streptococcus suis]NQR20708.1 hypothetical protein [Streptococcus suis]HEM2778488.1 hypothetical protein [Streptococcus suis]HEM2828822.1 hypothetical protein [Streptococcus suis]HEM4256028.1 hypothetical protein [Streptococcus suis]